MSKKIDFLSEIQNLEKVMPAIAKRTIEEYLGNDGKVQIDINLYEGAELFNRFPLENNVTSIMKYII